jgi:hypothetical protein
MAFTKQGVLTMSFLMSNTNPKTKRQKLSDIAVRLPAVEITAYNAAADDAARAATIPGTLIEAYKDLTLGVLKKVTAGFTYVDPTAIPPASDAFVFPFDKIGISFQADGENYVASIPARKDSALSMGPDGVSILITDPSWSAEIETFVPIFNANVLSEEGAAVTITQMTIPS